MKFLTVIASFLVFITELNAQDTIRYTSFEGDSLSWKGAGIDSGSVLDTFSVLIGDTTSGYDDVPFRQRIASGKRSWQVNDNQDTILFEPVVTTGYDSIGLKIRFTGTSLNRGQGLDQNDSILIFVAIDTNRFSSMPNMTITGSNNAQWGYDADSVLTSRADSFIQYNPPFGATDTLNTSSTAILYFKTGTNIIKLKILVANNQNKEVWNVDNIVLLGKKNRKLALNNYSWSIEPMPFRVVIHWHDEEPICDRRTVQRSRDGLKFLDLYTVDCKDFEGKNVNYSDENPLDGWSYYRIRDIDKGGSILLSDLKPVYRKPENIFKLYPTTAVSNLTIHSISSLDHEYILINSAGTTLKKGLILNHSENKLIVSDLSAGMYRILILSGGHWTYLPFIKI